MSILTQGTNLYFIDSALSSPAVVVVKCAISLNAGGSPADQIEDTCLEAKERSYQPGLRTPGQASMIINADSSEPSHVRLSQLANMNPPPTLKWAIGWSDGTAPPTLDIYDEFVLPSTRTWTIFDGYVVDFPVDFALNSVVATTIPIQRSGPSDFIPKV